MQLPAADRVPVGRRHGHLVPGPRLDGVEIQQSGLLLSGRRHGAAILHGIVRDVPIIPVVTLLFRREGHLLRIAKDLMPNRLTADGGRDACLKFEIVGPVFVGTGNGHCVRRRPPLLCVHCLFASPVHYRENNEERERPNEPLSWHQMRMWVLKLKQWDVERDLSGP